MPGVERLSLDLLLPVAEDCVKLGIPVMALFPVIDASLKDPNGNEASLAFDALGLVSGSARSGKNGEGDSLAGFIADLTPAQVAAFFADPAGSAPALLGSASARPTRSNRERTSERARLPPAYRVMKAPPPSPSKSPPPSPFDAPFAPPS